MRIKEMQVLCKKLIPTAKPNNSKHTHSLTHTAYTTYFSLKSYQIGVKWVAWAVLFQVMIQEFKFFPLCGSQHLSTEFSLGGWAKNGITLGVRGGNCILRSPSHCLKLSHMANQTAREFGKWGFLMTGKRIKIYMGSSCQKEGKLIPSCPPTNM